MTAPIGLLAASTLLWGWLCDVIWVAAPLALLLEGWRWTRSRWHLSAKDFQRVADFCTWAFVIQAGYMVLTKAWPLPILEILQWLPVALAPLMLAQLYSSAGRIELSALFLSLRTDSVGAFARERIDLSLAYAGICVLSAGAANVRTPWYFAAATALAIWALWGVRSRRYPMWLWCALVVVAVGLGYAGHHGLSRLQTWVFNLAIEYLHFDPSRTDPHRAATDIGHLGELKSSDRILLRVTMPSDAAIPLLLHRASYDTYASGTWYARNAQFADQLAGDAAGSWVLDRHARPQLEVVISEAFANGTGLLALPPVTSAVSGLAPAVLHRNRFGAIRVERAPGTVSYVATSGLGSQLSAEPGANDMQLPALESAALGSIVESIGLISLHGDEAVRALNAYFAQGFRYATYRSERADTRHAVSDFLLRSRAGHCEYFATATVLLARAAGIPARYATGFSVQEYSDMEGRYIVRERHAHAWARLYVNGAWRDVDTTPPQWFAEEGRSAKPWEWLTDLGSWLIFRFNEWRARPADEMSTLLSSALVLTLIGVLVWRLFGRNGFARAQSSARGHSHAQREESAVLFDSIERSIAAKGLPRLRAETALEWVTRIAPRFDPDSRSLLAALMQWHYRERFDPLKLSPDERGQYARAAERWHMLDPSPVAGGTNARIAVQPASSAASPQKDRQRA